MSENMSGGAPVAAAPSDTSGSSDASVDTSVDSGLDTPETGEDGQPVPAAKKETPAEKKRNLKKLKLKVDGVESEEEFDLDDEEALRKHFQMSKVAQKRMQESSQLQKEVADFIDDLRKNPRKILSDPNIGIDVKQLAAQIIEEEIENSKKSPEQIEYEKMKAELEEHKKRAEKEKEDSKKRELTALQQREFDRYDNLMTQALEKHTDLPKSPYVVKKMADYLLLGLQKGMNIEPEDVVDLVRQEMRSDLAEMFKVLPEDVIESLVGKDKLTSMRKKRLTTAKTAPKVSDTGASSAPKTEEGKKQSFSDFFRKR